MDDSLEGNIRKALMEDKVGRRDRPHTLVETTQDILVLSSDTRLFLEKLKTTRRLAMKTETKPWHNQGGIRSSR